MLLRSSPLAFWEDAWDSTCTATNGVAKQIADFAFAHWAQLLGSLGRTDQLALLFRQTEGRIFDRGPLQQMINGTREDYMFMHTDPGEAAPCAQVWIGNLPMDTPC